MQVAWDGIEQGLRIRGLFVEGGACLCQRDMTAAEPPGRAQRGFRVVAAVQQHVHPDLDVARHQQRAEPLKRGVFSVRREWIAAPCFAHQPFGGCAVAAGQQRAREHKPALAGDRLFAAKEREDDGIVALVVPQGCFATPPQERYAWPAWIFGNEVAVTFDRRTVVVAAQDHPFGKLACNRIGERGLKLRGIGRLPFTHELDDLLERIHVGL